MSAPASGGPAASTAPTIRIRPDQSVGVLNARELWRYRGLLGQMTRRQIATRILSSPTSVVWTFVRPAIMTLAFYFLRRASGADFGAEVPYPLFIFSGLCFWFLFAETAMQTSP